MLEVNAEDVFLAAVIAYQLTWMPMTPTSTKVAAASRHAIRVGTLVASLSGFWNTLRTVGPSAPCCKTSSTFRKPSATGRSPDALFAQSSINVPNVGPQRLLPCATLPRLERQPGIRTRRESEHGARTPARASERMRIYYVFECLYCWISDSCRCSIYQI